MVSRSHAQYYVQQTLHVHVYIYSGHYRLDQLIIFTVTAQYKYKYMYSECYNYM